MSRAFQYNEETWEVEANGGSHDGAGIQSIGATFSCGDRSIRGRLSPIGLYKLTDEQLRSALACALAPRVFRRQDGDGQEWFQITHERYFSLVRLPEHAHKAGYIGTEMIPKFNEDGVRHELTAHFGLDDAGISEVIDKARRQFVG